MAERIEQGGRVCSTEAYDGVQHEGTVEAITLEPTPDGMAPLLTVRIDKRGGQEIEPQVAQTPAVMWQAIGGLAEGPPTPPPPADEEACEHCGQVHEYGVFTKEMFKITEQFLESKDESAREMMLITLAEKFAKGLTSTDHEVTEKVHELVAKTTKAQMKAQELTLSLGRLVVQNVLLMKQQESERPRVLAFRLPGFPGGGSGPSSSPGSKSGLN